MRKFQHTEQTAGVYNSMIKEYREIQSDGDLERIGLEYRLRFDGHGATSSRNVMEWAKRHGCTITGEEDNWMVSLENTKMQKTR